MIGKIFDKAIVGFNKVCEFPGNAFEFLGEVLEVLSEIINVVLLEPIFKIWDMISFSDRFEKSQMFKKMDQKRARNILQALSNIETAVNIGIFLLVVAGIAIAIGHPIFNSLSEYLDETSSHTNYVWEEYVHPAESTQVVNVVEPEVFNTPVENEKYVDHDEEVLVTQIVFEVEDITTDSKPVSNVSYIQIKPSN